MSDPTSYESDSASSAWLRWTCARCSYIGCKANGADGQPLLAVPVKASKNPLPNGNQRPGMAKSLPTGMEGPAAKPPSKLISNALDTNRGTKKLTRARASTCSSATLHPTNFIFFNLHVTVILSSVRLKRGSSYACCGALIHFVVVRLECVLRFCGVKVCMT